MQGSNIAWYNILMSTENKLPIIDGNQITVIDPPKLIWIRVKDAVALLWPDNPKQHDIGSVILSIQKYGIQEIPKYDATLGAIKAGNGRVECLFQMERDRMPVPRGIGQTESGDWVMPLLVGTDAQSVAVAKAYAIDSNNLTVTGGNLSVEDIARLWKNDGYLNILKEVAAEGELPFSVSGDDIDFLMKAAGETKEPPPEAQMDRAEELQKVWQTSPGQLWGLGAGYYCPRCGKWHDLDKTTTLEQAG
jgi:hypothetical protein